VIGCAGFVVMELEAVGGVFSCFLGFPLSLIHTTTLLQLAHLDKDFRYMACSDLTEELKRETFKLDAVNETKVVDSVLKLLEDSSGDVQGVAVKCLGPLVKKIRFLAVVGFCFL
jgi:hypothetical protein